LRKERVIFDNLLVRIHSIIEMIWWTGLGSKEFEFPFAGSIICTFRTYTMIQSRHSRTPDPSVESTGKTVHSTLANPRNPEAPTEGDDGFDDARERERERERKRERSRRETEREAQP